MKNSILIIFLLYFKIYSSFFCECAYIKSIKDSFTEANFVATGKVKKIEYINIPNSKEKKIKHSQSIEEILSIPNGIPLAKVTLEIIETFKGKKRNKRIIYTTIGGGSCGFSFITNNDYLIYAYKENYLNDELKKYNRKFKNALHTNYCTRTKAYNKKEIRTIKKLIR